MRIGIDCRFYGGSAGGIGYYVQELVSHLLKIDSKNEYVLFFTKENFKECRLSSPNLTKKIVSSPYYSLSEQIVFPFDLRSQKLDIMHFTNFNNPLFWFGKFVVTIHDLTLMFFPGGKKKSSLHKLGYRLALLSACKKARKIIAVSRHTKKDIIRFFNIPDDKIKVIYEGIEDKYHPIEDRKFIEKIKIKYDIQTPYIMYIGAWKKHKNINNLIKAFDILKRKYKFPHKLVLMGKEDFLAEELKKEINKLDIKKDIVFTGFVYEEDLPALYNAASLFVFPSLYEGFGLPPLEALACGVPVVASNVSSLPEILGKSAEFFNPKDPEDMALKIRDVLFSKKRQEELVKKGFRQASQFVWEKTAQETLQVYEEVYKKN